MVFPVTKETFKSLPRFVGDFEDAERPTTREHIERSKRQITNDTLFLLMFCWICARLGSSPFADSLLQFMVYSIMDKFG